jgi:hypothetical protein
MKEKIVKITIKILALVLFMGNLFSMEEPSAKGSKKEEQEILQQEAKEIPLLGSLVMKKLIQFYAAQPCDEENPFRLNALVSLMPDGIYIHILELYLNAWPSLTGEHKVEIIKALLLYRGLSDGKKAVVISHNDKLKILMRFVMNPLISRGDKLLFLGLCKAFIQEDQENYQKSPQNEKGWQESLDILNTYIRPLVQFFEFCIGERQGAQGGHTTYGGMLKPSNIEYFTVRYELDYTMFNNVERTQFANEKGIRSLLYLLDDRLNIISPESARSPKEVIECFALLGNDFYTELYKVIGKSYHPSFDFFDFLDKQQKLQSFIVLEGKDGRTFLNQAFEYSRKDLAQVIVKAILQKYGSCHNLPPELKDIAGHIAIIAGDTKIACELITQENIEAYPDNNDHATPLWIAVLCNNTEVVKYLLDNGASVNLCNSSDDNQTLLNLAVALEHVECVKMLLEHGIDIAEQGFDEDTLASLEASDAIKELLSKYVQ